MNQPILQTKLYMPPNPQGLIGRPRLWQQLNGNFANGHQFQRKLTLVSAPPGFGKTTVIAEWLRQNGRSPAWLSLDPSDNDLSRFFLYVVAALQSVTLDFGQDLQTLLTHAQTVSVENMMPLLLNEITAVTEPIVLVLDDYHLIDHAPIQKAIEFLLAHQPQHFHLVIITRADPPINLARLRGQRQMVELRVKDLRFTHKEITQFIHQESGSDLSETDLDLLATRTEGWVTGLQLAALSWQGLDDMSAAIAKFGGNDRYIADYLLEEILQRQPQTIQQFLLHTSVLNRLNGALCDFVLDSDTPSSQEILEQLEKDNLFTIPLDNQRTWFRYHHLFADLLRQRLQQAAPDEVHHYHLRASQWFAAEGFIEEAISHALAAEAFERAATLLTDNRQLLVWEQRRLTSLWRWLEELPDALIKAHPSLAIMRAWLYLMMFDDWVQIEIWVQHVRDSLETAVLPVTERRDMQIELNLLEAILNRKQGHIDKAIQHTLDALAPMTTDGINRSSALSTLALLYEEQGNIALAVKTYYQSLAVSQGANHIYMAFVSISRLTELLIVQGHLQQAYALFSEFPSENERFGGADLGMVYISFGEMLRQRDQLSEAEDYLQKGVAFCQPYSAWAVIQIMGLISLAWVKQAQGDEAGAMNTIQDACHLDPGPYFYAAARPKAQQARLQLAQGDVDEAVRWAENCDLSPLDAPTYAYEVDYFTLARVLLAQKNLEAAMSLLTALQEATQTGERQGRLIEVLVLQAVGNEQMGKRPLALTTLKQATGLAEPEGYLRLFLDNGDVVISLLKQLAKEGIQPDFMAQLLSPTSPAPLPPTTARPKPSSYPLQPLTKREQETLNLLATNLAIPDIAEQLFVSISTVRTYTKHIYSKLDVHTRIEAIHRAEEIGLLPSA